MPPSAQRIRSDPADVAAFAAVRGICRRHAPGFYFASHFLPRPRRDAAYAVYSFCKMIREAIAADEAAVAGAHGLREHPAVAPRAASSVGGGGSDACCSGNSLDARVAMLRDRLDEIYTGGIELPQSAVRSEAQHALHAIAVTVQPYEIPRQHFLDFAEGYRRDLAVTRYATFRALEAHCDLVGGAPALMMGCVLGLTHSGAGIHALQLGRAMRLTAILRDLKQDWQRGHVYLPQTDLVRFRYSERDIAAGVVNESFRSLMKFEIEQARAIYRQAAEGFCWVAGDGSRFATSVVAMLHAGTLRAIERQGYDVFAHRAALSRGEQLRGVSGAWKLARRHDGERVPEVF